MGLNRDNTCTYLLRFKKIQHKIHYTAKFWETLYPNWMFAGKFIWCFIVQFYASSISNWTSFKPWTPESFKHKENSAAHIHLRTNWQVMLSLLHLLQKLIPVASTHKNPNKGAPHNDNNYTKIKPSSSWATHSKQMAFQSVLWIIHIYIPQALLQILTRVAANSYFIFKSMESKSL